MVSYQVFTKLAFDVAESKGGTFSNIQDGGEFVSEVAAVWNDDKERIKQMTQNQARNYLQELVEA